MRRQHQGPDLSHPPEMPFFQNPPSGHSAEERKDLIDAIRETNRQLSRLADKRHVFFSNPGLVLQEGNSGTLRKACTMDGIHLSSTGYSILADELADLLHRMDPQYKGGKVPRPAKIDGMDPDQVHLVAIGDSITDNYRKDNLPCQDFLPIWKNTMLPTMPSMQASTAIRRMTSWQESGARESWTMSPPKWSRS